MNFLGILSRFIRTSEDICSVLIVSEALYLVPNHIQVHRRQPKQYLCFKTEDVFLLIQPFTELIVIKLEGFFWFVVPYGNIVLKQLNSANSPVSATDLILKLLLKSRIRGQWHNQKQK